MASLIEHRDLTVLTKPYHIDVTTIYDNNNCEPD